MKKGAVMVKKPKWVVAKEQSKKASAAETVWLFGLHAVRDALVNPNRDRLRLVVTRNAMDKLADATPTIMLAEKLSDTISGLAPLAPMDLPVWKSPNHKNAQR